MILEQVEERVLDDAVSSQKARLSKLIGSDRAGGGLGRQGGFSIESVWEVFCPCNVWAHWCIGKGVERKLWCVPWCATINFIWHDHSRRLHDGQAHEPNVLFQIIQTCVRACVVS
ncbi:uncharacterized protein E5676_scaffold455G002580 [Cucumis melo var. makuwa]|uniref:Uncharacterized protein n=1 Tax=Cucumis melo var. makuwa TaxID=1194695 RepID=A0A5D3E5Y3_CUCMM|nr:uncharacterized protein E6C27_scaffold285G001770 [Cucumis melo var. makuwa]TYK31011.1 uncharacterized protein E5676_scaffold455G002580 [Cucumis melo var. makuwa]